MCLFLNVHHFFFSKAEGPSKCIDNLCVEEEDLDKPKVPEEYFLAADGDYFYVSTIELPWAQAQYDCLARKGHLAELDGKLDIKKCHNIISSHTSALLHKYEICSKAFFTDIFRG